VVTKAGLAAYFFPINKLEQNKTFIDCVFHLSTIIICHILQYSNLISILQ